MTYDFKLPLLVVVALLFGGTAHAQTVTFHEDIAPLIYTQCTECHREGEIGPMPFTTYEEVSAFGSFIEYVTQTNYMPPWTPDHNYSSLRGERFLTDDQKALISAWVQQGMLEGDPANNPGLPNFPEGSQIGEPDLVLSMPEPFTHMGNMQDQYQVFVIPTGFTEPTEIAAVEIRPGNSAVDHHALIGYTDNPSVIAQAQNMDAADPNPGYESFGDYGVNVEQFLFGGWVPGTPPLEFPPTIGHVAQPGSHLLLQMHYGPSAVEQTDQTEINLFLPKSPFNEKWNVHHGSRLSRWGMGLVHHSSKPSDHLSWFGDLVEDISLISVTPHCHLLGQAWEVFARSPNAQDTIPLISIPEWDFNWQGIFTYPQMVRIPSGYVVEAYATYDNTSSNLFNPNGPPQTMFWGDFTTEEMYVLFFKAFPTKKETSTLCFGPRPKPMVVYQHDNLFPAWPNPVAQGEVKVGFHLRQPAEVTLVP